jgi:hypothetical protein
MIKSWLKTTKFIKDVINYAQGIIFLGNIGRHVQVVETKSPIIINNVDYTQFQTLFFESLIAAKFRTLGLGVKILVDDGVMRHIDMDMSEKILIGRKYSLREKVFGIILNRYDSYIKYSEIIDVSKLAEIPELANRMIETGDFRYLDVDLKEYVESSVIKAYRSAKGLAENETSYKDIFKICTENSIISILAAEGADKLYAPDRVVTSHGIYSTYGPFYKYFKVRDRSVSVWGYNPYSYGTVQLSNTGIVSSKTDDGFFNTSKDTISDSVASKYADIIMQKRFNCDSDDHLFFGGKVMQDEELENLIAIKSNGKKVFALFTNVLWDDSMVGIDTIFSSAVEWIIETINYFMNQSDKLLIVRAHPDEMFSGTRVTVNDLIESQLNVDIKNIESIIFIPSEVRLSSYSLFSYIDAGIVYNGTIGLEMLYKKIPVIIAARAPYSGKGLTYDIQDLGEYYKLIEDIGLATNTKFTQEDVLAKFIYYTFILHGIPLKAFKSDKWASPNIAIGHEGVVDDVNLTHIAEVILGNREFFQEWEKYGMLEKENTQ